MLFSFCIHSHLVGNLVVQQAQKVWQNTGGRKLSSAFVILLCFGSGLDVSNLAFSCYLKQKFFNQHLCRA